MKVTAVGLGPGAGADMTGRARRAIEKADLVVGYTAYIDLIREEFPGKEMISTGMRREADRCRAAVEAAAGGKNVAVVCSGDSGIYGMAGLLFELAAEESAVTVEVIPGVTAASGGAALLGAPLTNDFAVLSLSDLLTPWETIERRLALAAEADLVLCLYNPRSRHRPEALRRACQIILEHRPAGTPCGLAWNIGRDGERTALLTLAALRDNEEADMFTTAFVGNSKTFILNGHLVTPRGYLQRED